MQDPAATSAALRSLYQLTARVAGVRTLDATLQAVVDGVVEAVGFQVAAINYRRADGRFEMVAVAGSDDARAALLGTVSEPGAYDVEFARADGWGSLRFVPHDRLGADEIAGWVPDVEVADGPDAWHPLDALFAPLTSAAGELVGVLSVDLPRDGRRPGSLQRELLEMFAAHAGIAIDNARLTEELRVEHQRVAASEASLLLAFDGADVGMAMVETTGELARVNEALARITGRPVDELTGADAATVLGVDVTGPPVHAAEQRLVRPDRSEAWLGVSTSLVHDADGDVVQVFVQVDDVTERRHAEERLTEAARHDPLTGLLNRLALRERLDAAVAQHRRGAVLFCDLDGFKQVNDALGHAAGDVVLTAVAERIAREIRGSDIAARFGGDELVVLVDDITEADLHGLVSRIERAVAEPIPYGDRWCAVTVSIGVAWLDDVLDADGLLRQADIAMYEVKSARGAATASRPS